MNSFSGVIAKSTLDSTELTTTMKIKKKITFTSSVPKYLYFLLESMNFKKICKDATELVHSSVKIYYFNIGTFSDL